MKKSTIKTVTYEMPDDFMLDIVTNDECYEVWIYNKEYCIKSMAFGMKKSDVTMEEFIEIVMANYQEDKEFYEDEYMY